MTRRQSRGARSRYQHTRRSNNSDGRRRKLALLVSVPVATLALLGVGLNAYMKIEQPDDSYCYARAAQHQEAISLDNSFIFQSSAAQIRDYRVGMAEVWDRVPANARISIFTSANDVDGSFANPVFTMCKPAATVEEQAEIGAPAKPAPYLKRQFAEAKASYFQALDEVLSDAQDASKSAGDSRILERVQAISRHKYFSSADRGLTIITDGIQNSDIARFCAVKGDMPSFKKFSKRADYKHIEPEPLDGVVVNLLLVEFGTLPAPILPFCTNNELRKWWPDFFEGNGTHNVQTTRITYGVEG